MSTTPSLHRRALRVRGVVQGVGFRPFVYSLARRHSLTGFVGNDSSGVFLEIQGVLDSLDAFERELVAAPPPLAHIQEVAPRSIAVLPDESDFVIVESEAQAGASTPISPDIATCADCLAELFDPRDRRHRYPFLNCTNCGPRFTITRDIPYDRPQTTMAGFRLCADCDREYHDPGDRRFHAQPTACPRCGPLLRYRAPGKDDAVREEALCRAREALARGEIVAVKGIGGFHLACDATRDDAVASLRQRKQRTDKPFAVLFPGIEAIRRYAWIEEEEERLLTGRERPIVLVRTRRDAQAARLSDLVAPGNAAIGALLPYSPLHYLLVEDRPLVLTSGNLGDEPIVKDNEEASNRLSGLADGYLLHDRDIHVVCDDSVVRVLEGREYPIRRSRGYAPLPVPLPRSVPSVLAVGGELKATFCLTRDRHAYLSQHIGDMGNLETLHAFERAFDHLRTLFRITPTVVVCDRHPGYLSSHWAERHASDNGLSLVRVQHHHAHLASLMAENGLDGSRPILGVCFDGTGYGDDGAIWGGELLLASYGSFRRLGYLRYVPLPGGDASIRRPYRSALAHLYAAGIPWDEDLACVRACPPAELRVLARQIASNIQCVPSSSMGRLFDAVAALLGIRGSVTYEAQAAIEMEALAAEPDGEEYAFRIEGDPLVIDPGDVLRGIIADRRRGVPIAVLAGRFHNAVAKLISDLAVVARERTGIEIVGLSGGVFQNVLLLRRTVARLRAAGFETLLHRLAPANDGGLALGQAAIVCLGVSSDSPTV